MRTSLHRIAASTFLLFAVCTPAKSAVTDDVKNRAIVPAASVFACGAAATIWWGDVHNSSSGIPVGLAIADFTGDSHPDLATIKLDRFDSSSAQYLIEIQLTEGGHQSLTLTAPQRGLFITPKDVTGDGTLDLVVRAVGFQSPVAVFLNDGCGHFSAHEPSRFARTIRDVPTNSEFGSIEGFLGAPALAQGNNTIACEDDRSQPLQFQKSSLNAGIDLALRRFDSSFGTNRAPPTSL